MRKAQVLAWLKSRRVAVLKGGWSRERPISLKTGQAVQDSFKRLGIRVTPVDVRPNFLSVLKKKKINFAFIALHGTFGEDGQVQGELGRAKIAYTGSDAFSSSIAMNKQTSKVLFESAGIKTPPGLVLTKQDYRSNARTALKPIRQMMSKGSVFVKPVDQGSAIGISCVKSSRMLSSALQACFRVSDEAMVEKFVPGRELTVGVLGKQTLPVIEIVPEHAFYDYHSKYAKGGSRHIIPASLPSKLAKTIQKISLKAFQTLGCSVYGRVDVILSKRGVPFVLEVNTIPGMTGTSLLPEAARAVGMSFDDLVLNIVSLSAKEKR